MPTYAYRCSDCGHTFDIRQSFADDALTICPECGGRLHKQYGSVGVTFKGSGFYRTDSRKGSSSSIAARSDKPASSDKSGASASSGKISSTPAASAKPAGDKK